MKSSKTSNKKGSSSSKTKSVQGQYNPVSSEKVESTPSRDSSHYFDQNNVVSHDNISSVVKTSHKESADQNNACNSPIGTVTKTISNKNNNFVISDSSDGANQVGIVEIHHS